ncbi:MAG: hypothetical protein QOD99_2212, partial [Chthoniobacter sp.]|nr:hypothetical protein [Chthoniobacter sp.]
VDASVLTWAAAVTLIVAIVWTATRAISLAETAVLIDSRAKTRDRLITVLSIANNRAPTVGHEVALEECCRFLTQADLTTYARVRVPEAAHWLIVPAITLALLWWNLKLAGHNFSPTPPTHAQLVAAADQLEELQRKVEDANESAKSEDLEKIGEALRKSAMHLRDGDGANGDSKAMLRELSSIEMAVERSKRDAESALARLAAALQKAGSPAGDSLRAGEIAKAAGELESAIDQAARIAEALRSGGAGTAGASGELAKAMASMAGATAQEDLQRALQQLAAALRHQSESVARNGDANHATQEILKALQGMKYGRESRLSSSPKPAGQKKENADAFVATSSGGPMAAASDQAIAATGQPGSERDEGTTKTVFGKRNAAQDAAANPIELAGALGEGDSLQSLVSTHGDSSKATERYRDLYNAMAPAAEDAMMQENIPLGSRFFVKRYFESIRPQE